MFVIKNTNKQEILFILVGDRTIFFPSEQAFRENFTSDAYSRNKFRFRKS